MERRILFISSGSIVKSMYTYFLQSKKYLFKSLYQFSHFTPERHKDVHYSLRPSYGLMACFARPITEYAPIPISPNQQILSYHVQPPIVVNGEPIRTNLSTLWKLFGAINSACQFYNLAPGRVAIQSNAGQNWQINKYQSSRNR